MPIYKIADLNIEINPKYEKTSKQLAAYITDEKTADFCVEAEQSEIDRLVADGGIDYLSESCIINTLVCREILDNYDGLFFHSSALMLDGKAYLFSAPSGTGKSTHTALWQRHFGGRVQMINDDKPIIRKKGGVFYVYGTPWMGKADIGTNTKAPVKAVYILQRAEENTAVRVLPSQVMKQLLEATVIDVERSRMEKLLELLDEFFKETPLFLLGCNMDESAVMMAYNAANGG